MKLNQNILSPHNNFTKVDASSISVTLNGSESNAQIYAAEWLLDNYLRCSQMPTGDYAAQLQYLDRKIEATRKTISSWESYRISAVATGEEDLQQKLGTLQPNTGLVINSLESASIQINNQSYSRGDIVFKDINNQQHHIASYSGGYYYPSSLDAQKNEKDEATGSYILSYTYATSAPSLKNSQLTATKLSQPAQNINMAITPATEIGSYGISQSIQTQKSIECEYISNIQPVVAWYMITDKNSGKGERVYFDDEYTISNGKITCANNTNCELWVEVR